MTAAKKQPEKHEHGPCPTCGHCKCCENAGKPVFAPYYPDWTYRPWLAPWYQITTSSAITIYPTYTTSGSMTASATR